MSKIDLTEIKEFFTEQGDIKVVRKNFELRERQDEIAIEVAKVINSDLSKHSDKNYDGEFSKLIVEAGTGMGKTFSYLVPIIKCLENNKNRFIISTDTRILQNQLIRDINTFNKKLNVNVIANCLMGRSNYLCTKNLMQLKNKIKNKEEIGGKKPLTQEYDKLIEEFKIIFNFFQKSSTTNKDISYINNIPERSDIWYLVTSNHHNCKEFECNKCNNCMHRNANTKAKISNVLIVNNSLLISKLKQSDNQGIFKNCQYIVFDEAHALIDNLHDLLAEKLRLNDLVYLLIYEFGGFLNTDSNILAQIQEYARLIQSYQENINEFFKNKRNVIVEDKKNLEEYRAYKLFLIEEFKNEFNNLLEFLEILNAQLSAYKVKNNQSKFINTVKEQLDSSVSFLRRWKENNEDNIYWIDYKNNSCEFKIVEYDVAKKFSRIILTNYSTMYFSSTLAFSENIKENKLPVALNL